MKAAVITIEWKSGKVLSSFFDGENCPYDANSFYIQMKGDFKEPNFHTIITHDKEAQRKRALDTFGIDIERDEK
ncbi:MAG: hypothetical protein KGJ90_06845 [Patescibacteria group bacterium]|nr:hypothetical protein [Patescibacteria group bacterium]